MWVVLYGFCSKFHVFQQCKNFENPLRFDKVAESLKVGIFETQCTFGEAPSAYLQGVTPNTGGETNILVPRHTNMGVT